MFNQNFGTQPYGYGQAMPYMPDFQKQTQPQNNVSWVYVNGIDGAKSQIVQPGQTSWMMDNNDPVIYVKAVDSMGTATLKAFKLTEISANSTPNNQQADLSAYAQKSDLDGIMSRLSALEDLIGGINT